MIFCCCSSLPSTFKVFYIHRGSSKYLNCNEWLSEFLLPSNQFEAVGSLSSDFWYPQSIFGQITPAHWIFFFTLDRSLKPRDDCVGKSQ